MPRTKGGVSSHNRHKKTLKSARGFYGTRNRLYKTARDAVRKGLAYAYAGRKIKKRDYRALWIVRINAAARDNELSYSRFMAGLKSAGIDLDRRVLAHIALNDPAAFTKIAELARTSL